MDIDIAARIWDNFLIDGEVFAIRMALAILKCFEHSLQRMTHTEILKKLKFLHGLLNEEVIFKILDTIDISGDEYYEEIRK